MVPPFNGKKYKLVVRLVEMDKQTNVRFKINGLIIDEIIIGIFIIIPLF